jgi:signal transduction histidine kinase
LCGAARSIRDAQAGTRAENECRIATASRTAYDFRITASPIEWQGQDYVLMVLSDISDEKRRLVLERIFFHDVLNTAGGVAGIAALIAEDPASGHELKDDLLRAAETLVSEIKSQRMLQAAESNALCAENDLVGARGALETVRQVYRNHPAARGRTVEIDTEGADSVVNTDPAILQRVLGNMLKNALEATPPGGIVWLGADTGPERCTFWCQNSREIPREVALQVFQRSFTTKGNGRGIGTYSMKLLGERVLGGSVSFTTSAEEGTRFQISLPRLP